MFAWTQSTWESDLLKKRICYISPWSIHSYRWLEAFYQKGYDLSFITDTSAWIAPRPPEMPVHIFPTLDKYNLERLAPNMFGVTKVLRKTQPDFVHVHVYPHYGLLVMLNRFPFVLTSWGLEVLLLSRLSFLRRALSKTVARHARRITVDAQCLKDIWVSLGVPGDKIDVIPFGVDADVFSPEVDGRGVRKKLNIEEDDISVISTRPLYNHHYNVECLIRAIPLVLRRHKNVTFVVKGVGPLEDYLKSLAEELHVYEHVRFVGLVPYREIARYLVASDIYVSTSYFDSTSVSLLEAMACGRPVVTTDIAGNREWITDGVNGLLYPAEDHNVLADRIVQLIEDESLRRQFGERSRRIVLERGVWEKCVSKMEAVYQSI